MKIEFNETCRTPHSQDDSIESIDGLRNHFHVTQLQGQPKINLSRGINVIRSKGKGPGSGRVAAIILRTSSHKVGSATTPWQDVYDLDRGHLRYFGDNKSRSKRAHEASGNKALLEAYETHVRESNRDNAVPLVFYRSEESGKVIFSGFGIIERIELVTQVNTAGLSFSNYAFDCVVFNLQDENEQFNWSWINDRRNPKLDLQSTIEHAPSSWKSWVRAKKSIESIRRNVARIQALPGHVQRPEPGSKLEKTLKDIYGFYQNRKDRFELLALKVIEHLVTKSNGHFIPGWITSKGSDGGADFYGRIDVGRDFSLTKIIVLGQAKCEKLDTPTGGNHIARTVARLQRGWIGAYVTTSYFSLQVQREIIEDSYPIMMVNGLEVATVVEQMKFDRGITSVTELLEEIDEEHDSMVANRRPEEVLTI